MIFRRDGTVLTCKSSSVVLPSAQRILTLIRRPSFTSNLLGTWSAPGPSTTARQHSRRVCLSTMMMVNGNDPAGRSWKALADTAHLYVVFPRYRRGIPTGGVPCSGLPLLLLAEPCLLTGVRTRYFSFRFFPAIS